jgi:hypothetical protein
MTSQTEMAARTEPTTTFLAQKSQLNWAVEIPDEIAEVMGISSGSVLVLRAQFGDIVVEEIVPPPSPELRSIVDEIIEDNKEFYAELKRLGD